MRKADRIFGVIGLGFALWCYLESKKFDYMTEFTPGPGFLPFWVGVTLAILSCYLLFDTFRRKGGAKDSAKLLPEKHALYRVGFILLMLFVVKSTMNTLGFPLTLFLFTVVILKVLEKYSIIKSVGYGIAYAAVTWFVFEYVLTMGFPKGFLGI
ncbi:MAG: tripartite tricarboxylate transporter TctB family protein [Deltaproteobacteria bacterium]|nr:tripartite tricarboxylate transporter TctB family protein [Deltaproteobacteria bacterium]